MLFLALLLQTASAPTPPTMPMGHHGGTVSMTCPVGGASFEAWQSGTYSTYGARPDGKPYSYMPFPFPLPECPSNRLVMFDEFSPADVALLASAIAAPDYRALVDRDTPHYRAYWLARRIGRPDVQALDLLLQAIWATTPGPSDNSAQDPRSDRYQQEFVDRVRALPATTPVADRRWLQARAANALRQLGRFGEAEALRTATIALPPARGEMRDARAGWTDYLTMLGTVIAARDVQVEPLTMMPSMQRAMACIDRPKPTAADQAICNRPEIAKDAAEIRAVRARAN